MAADGGADVVDQNLAVQVGKFAFHQVGHGLRVFQTCGVADVTFAVVGGTVLRIEFHLSDDGFNDFLFGTDLLAGDQFAFVVYIQKRADI